MKKLLTILFALLLPVTASAVYIVDQGGTGSTTLTGLLKGNGKSMVQTAIGGTDYVLPSALASYLSLSSWYATNTDALHEGSTNLYYTNPRVQTYLDSLSKGYFYSTTSADYWTKNSAINIYSLGGVLDASLFPGSDIGQKINNAYAALPSYGGTITVPNGVYAYSTSISFSTAGKEALLKCSPGKSTVLNYTGTGVAITIDANTGIGHNVGYGIDGCHFTGTVGNIASTTGLVTGGTNGAEGIVIQNSVFEIFGKAVELKNKTWLASFKNDFFTNNVMALYATSSGLTNFGENIQFDHVTFGADTQTNAVNCIQINRGGFNDFHFINSSFDNCQVAITDTVGISTNNIRITDSHFENPSDTRTPYDFITVARNPNNRINLTGVSFLQDSPTIVPAQYITNGGVMSMINVSAEKLFSATTTTNFVTLLNPNDVVRSIGFTYGPGAVKSFYNNEGLSSAAMQFMNASTSGQKISLVSNGQSATTTFVMGKGLNHATRSEIQYDSYNGIFSLNNVYNGLLKLKTNDTDRLTITGSGDVGIGSINPATKLQVDGVVTAQAFSATTTSATSTLLGSLQIGGTSGTNMVKISDSGYPYTPSASNSVGGMINVTQTGLGSGMVMYTNVGATANGSLLWLRCDNAAYTKDCASISNDGTGAGISIASTNGAALNISNSGNMEHTAVISYTGTSSSKGALSVSDTNQNFTAASISGYQTTGGTLNLAHTGGQPSDANASALSISLVSTSTGSLAQGIFMDSSGSATGGKLLNLRNGGIEYLTLLSTGKLGIGSTSPWAKLSVQGTSGQYDDIFSVASSSLATLFNVNYKGYVGIGSSTPWGILSIIDPIGDSHPGIVMATSSGATVFWGATASTSDALGDPVRMLVGWGTKFLTNFDTFAQLSVNGEINTNNTISLECRAEGMKKTAQITSDITGSVISTTLGYPCGDFSYIEDANGVANYVSGVTGNYIRLSTGAAGTIAAAGDGMGMALTTAGLYTATNTPLKLEVSARPVVNNATSTLYLLGFFNTTGVSANYAAMPTAGCGFVASTTQANWRAFCGTGSAYTYLDTGIASTTNIASPANGSFTRFRVEMGTTYAVFRYLRGSVGDTNSWVTIGSISTNYPNTAALNPTVAVGSVSAKLSDELQVRFIRAWYNDPEPY